MEIYEEEERCSIFSSVSKLYNGGKRFTFDFEGEIITISINFIKMKLSVSLYASGFLGHEEVYNSFLEECVEYVNSDYDIDNFKRLGDKARNVVERLYNYMILLEEDSIYLVDTSFIKRGELN